jgi:hypothetical protein
MNRIMKEICQGDTSCLGKGATVPIYKIHDMKFYHSYGGKNFSFNGIEVQELQLRKYILKKIEVTLGEEQYAFIGRDP